MQILDRRDFLQALAALAAGSSLARLAAPPPGEQAAIERVAGLQSYELVALPLKFPGRGATLAGYLARPADGARYPAKIILWEGAELDQSLRECVRGHAGRGCVVLAIDPRSRHGGSGSCPARGAGKTASQYRNSGQTREDLTAALQYLRSSPFVERDRIEIIRL